MKIFLTLALLLSSAISIAHTCHISLYDPYDRPYLNFYSQQDLNCQAAAQKCYQTISANRLNPYQYKCYTVSMVNDPAPEVRPVTRADSSRVARPLPSNSIAADDQDYRRELEIGESVIYQGKLAVVTFMTPEGLYEIRPEDGKKKDIVQNLERKDLAITRGCLRKICTKTSVISKSQEAYMSVEGIDYLGRYVLQAINSKDYVSDVEFYNLVKTQGCVEIAPKKICTENAVMDRYNRYFEVVGIQSENLLVISDDAGKLYFNVDPRGLILTR